MRSCLSIQELIPNVRRYPPDPTMVYSTAFLLTFDDDPETTPSPEPRLNLIDDRERTPTPKPRLILADDHTAMLRELTRLLQRDCEVMAAVADGDLAVKSAKELKPDVMVLDIHMPRMGGIEAAQELRRLGCEVKIVFLTIERDPEYVRVATATGASYVLKSRMQRDLLTAIRETLAGNTFVSPM
jgi:CheY-like chemotaxis protein